jgi:hypothetical protein
VKASQTPPLFMSRQNNSGAEKYAHRPSTAEARLSIFSLNLFSTSNPNTNKKLQPDKLNIKCKLCKFIIIVRQKIKMIWLALFPLITFATISSCSNCCQERRSYDSAARESPSVHPQATLQQHFYTVDSQM